MPYDADDDVINASSVPNLFYETRDLYEASAIRSLNHSVIDVKKEDGVCYFVFDNKQDCEDIVNDYRNRKLTVNAKSFTESIKTMKNFIYSGERRVYGRD